MHPALIPAVDVLGDEAVRLRRGGYDDFVARGHDPVELARRFAAAGARWIHLVDLDGARDGAVRPELVRRIVASAQPAAVQAAGGIRTLGDARTLLRAGAQRVVVGTAAFAHADALARFADALGHDLVVAIDVRGEMIATHGWTVETTTLEDALHRCGAAAVRRLLCTSIARDGTGTGPDVGLVARVAAIGIPVIAAGGVRDSADVDALLDAGAEAVVAGRALLGPASSPPRSDTGVLG